MDPQNTQPPAPSAPPIVEPAPEVSAPTPPDKKSPLQLIMGLLAGLKPKASQKPQASMATPQMADETQAVVSEPVKGKFKISKKLVIILVVIIVIFIALAVLMSMVAKNGGTILPTPVASATPTPTPIVEVPSQYADDQDVAEIQKQMEELDKSLNESSFRDETLRVPTLDWNVSFEE